MANLKRKIILVTGASSGIGRECVRVLSNEGAHIIALGRSKEKLIELYSQEQKDISILCQDLTDFDNYSKWVPKIGKIDGIIHSAGQTSFEPIRLVKKKKLDQLMALNLMAPVFLTKELIQTDLLNKFSSVVFFSSIAIDRPGKTQILYALSKAGLAPATKAFTAEFSKTKGIRFNCIKLGMVETPMLDENRRILGEKIVERQIESYPLGIGKVNDVASYVSYLMSNESRWLTGAESVIDGGRLCFDD